MNEYEYIALHELPIRGWNKVGERWAHENYIEQLVSSEEALLIEGIIGQEQNLKNENN